MTHPEETVFPFDAFMKTVNNFQAEVFDYVRSHQNPHRRVEVAARENSGSTDGSMEYLAI